MGKALDNQESSNERDFWLKVVVIVAIVLLAILICVVVIWICQLYLSHNKPELAEKIVNLILGFAGGLVAGLGGGFGLGQWVAKPKKSE